MSLTSNDGGSEIGPRSSAIIRSVSILPSALTLMWCPLWYAAQLILSTTMPTSVEKRPGILSLSCRPFSSFGMTDGRVEGPLHCALPASIARMVEQQFHKSETPQNRISTSTSNTAADKSSRSLVAQPGSLHDKHCADLGQRGD